MRVGQGQERDMENIDTDDGELSDEEARFFAS